MKRGGAAVAALAVLLLAMPVAARPDRALQEQLLAHIKILASDDFAGREPGTTGETKTLRYIGKQFYDMGLVSGTNQPANPWFAPVKLVGREPAGSVAQFFRRGRVLPVAQGDVLMLTSGRRGLVQGAPVVFVGRGAAIPPRAELAGRVAVLLDDDGALKPEADYSSAAQTRQNALLAGGAAAVLTVLDGQRTLAGIAARRKRTAYALASEAQGGDMEGYIAAPAFAQLLASGPDSLPNLQREAARPDFVARPLDMTASLEATTRETVIRTHNIIGKLAGRKPERGAVVLMAHWDHFGQCPASETRPDQRVICHGAVDNASGVAAMLEVARRLTRIPGGMDRDVYVVATTGEEIGLLGAEAFAENPPIPLKNIVAAFNIDSVAIAPAGTALGVVGKGMTPLDSGIATVAREQKRKLSDSTAPNLYIRRQDGWALMAHDLPAVMVTSAYGEIARLENFFGTHYHNAADVVGPDLELGGAAEDVAFHVALVQYFADTLRYPGTVDQRSR